MLWIRPPTVATGCAVAPPSMFTMSTALTSIWEVLYYGRPGDVGKRHVVDRHAAGNGIIIGDEEVLGRVPGDR